jgi:hypothetical protein
MAINRRQWSGTKLTHGQKETSTHWTADWLDNINGLDGLDERKDSLPA